MGDENLDQETTSNDEPVFSKNAAHLPVTITPEDDTPEDDPEDQPEEPPSRKQRRKQRGQDLVREARAETEIARREAAEAKAAIAELRQQINSQPRPQQPAAPQDDPLDAEVQSYRREYQAYLTRYGAAAAREGGLTNDERQAFEREGWELADKQSDIQYRRAAKKYGQGNGGASVQQVQAQLTQDRFYSEHPDMRGNQQLLAMFTGQLQVLRAQGKPDNWETVNEAADAARAVLRLPPKGGRPAPTEATKSKLSGQGRGGVRADAEAPSGAVEMTKDMRRLADAAYPHIKDDRKRYQHFVNELAKKKT